MKNDNSVFIRELEIESYNITLKFIQKKIGDVSCVVWDAAIVLAKYLDLTNQKNNWLKGKNVLELGAGLGCAGITASCLGANVVLTDLENALPLLNKNINVNEKQLKILGGTATAQILDWETEMNFDFKPDIILVADCVYYEVSVKPLLQMLQFLCDGTNETYILLSQEQRDTPKQISIWHDFLTQLSTRFEVKNIPIDEQHPKFSSPDIDLMKIYKRT